MSLNLKAVVPLAVLFAAGAAVCGCDASAETVQRTTSSPSLASAAPGGVPFDDALRAALRRYPYLGKVIDIGPILNALASETCQDFSRGRTTRQVIATRFRDASIEMTGAAFDIAVDSLCPQYRGWADRTR